jgi:hypothetical protein
MGKDISTTPGLQTATTGPNADAGPQPCKVEANKSKKQTKNQ